jgi:hypothetical protein
MPIITGTSHEDQYTFFIISRSVLLLIRNVSDKVCRENKKKHILCSITFFLENRPVYEITWKKYCATGHATDNNIGACALHAA